MRLLDGAIVIPGTRVRIGLDALLGFFAPGAGDAASAIATSALIWLGFTLGVPKVVLVRMLANTTVDAVIGAIPLIGDLFDVWFRASERNLALLHKYAGNPHKKPGFGDYAVLALCLICVLALLALPILTGLALLHLVAEFSSGS